MDLEKIGPLGKEIGLQHGPGNIFPVLIEEKIPQGEGPA